MSLYKMQESISREEDLWVDVINRIVTRCHRIREPSEESEDFPVCIASTGTAHRGGLRRVGTKLDVARWSANTAESDRTSRDERDRSRHLRRRPSSSLTISPGGVDVSICRGGRRIPTQVLREGAPFSEARRGNAGVYPAAGSISRDLRRHGPESDVITEAGWIRRLLIASQVSGTQ